MFLCYYCSVYPTSKTLGEILHAFRCFHYYAFVMFLSLGIFLYSRGAELRREEVKQSWMA